MNTKKEKVSPPDHDCKADGEHGCEVCAEWWADCMDKWAEKETEDERE